MKKKRRHITVSFAEYGQDYIRFERRLERRRELRRLRQSRESVVGATGSILRLLG